MTELWIALGLCAALIASGALPLLKERRRGKGPTRPELPKRETLRDWRAETRRDADTAGRRQD